MNQPTPDEREDADHDTIDCRHRRSVQRHSVDVAAFRPDGGGRRHRRRTGIRLMMEQFGEHRSFRVFRPLEIENNVVVQMVEALSLPQQLHFVDHPERNLDPVQTEGEGMRR